MISFLAGLALGTILGAVALDRYLTWGLKRIGRWPWHDPLVRTWDNPADAVYDEEQP